MANFSVTWEAPEFEYREKTVSWYWASIIVAALVIGFSVWAKNFLFGVFIVLAEIMLIFWGNRTPALTHFTITDEEIDIEGKKGYTMKEFDTWSVDTTIVDEGGLAEIIFVFKSRFKVPLVMLIPAPSLADLRLNLRPLLKEVEYQPSLIDSIEKFLGF